MVSFLVCLLCSSMFWPCSTSAVPNPSFVFECAARVQASIRSRTLPLNTVFYADEQKLDSNKRPNLPVRVLEPSICSGARRCCQNIPLHRDGLNLWLFPFGDCGTLRALSGCGAASNPVRRPHIDPCTEAMRGITESCG